MAATESVNCVLIIPSIWAAIRFESNWWWSWFMQELTHVCGPLYLLISNKDVPLTTIARSLQGYWDYLGFLHIRTNNFFVDDKTIYFWCELIEYIFTTCCKSPLELNIWPTMNSPIGCPVRVFSHGVQSLDTTWSMFSTFSNCGDGAKWYCSYF